MAEKLTINDTYVSIMPTRIYSEKTCSYSWDYYVVTIAEKNDRQRRNKNIETSLDIQHS